MELFTATGEEQFEEYQELTKKYETMCNEDKN